MAKVSESYGCIEETAMKEFERNTNLEKKME
jgi:hypothetical protein